MHAPTYVGKKPNEGKEDGGVDQKGERKKLPVKTVQGRCGGTKE